MVIKVYDIGKVVKYNGVRLQVVKAVQGCQGCYFKTQETCHSEIVGACCKPWRCQNVIFRKYDEKTAEKVEAFGGKGNKKLITWNFGKNITLELVECT